MFRLLFVFALLLSGYNAGAKYEHILHKTYAERYLSLDSIFSHWDFWSPEYKKSKELVDNEKYVSRQLDSLEAAAYKAGDMELVYETRLFRILLDIKWKNKVFPDTFTKNINEIIQKAHENNFTPLEIKARQYAGFYRTINTGHYTEAVREYLQCYYLMKRIGTREMPDKVEHLYFVASAYYAFEDYVRAGKILDETISLSNPHPKTISSIRPNKTGLYINIYNTRGLIHRMDHQYDSAIYYLTLAHDLAVKTNFEVWKGITTGNIGICYYEQRMYEEAIPLLVYDIKTSFKYHEINNGLNSLIKLADIYVQKSDFATARKLLDSARATMPRMTYGYKDVFMQPLSILYARYYEYHGNPNLAYRYMDTANQAMLSRNKREHSVEVARQKSLMEIKIYEDNLLQIEEEKRRYTIKRNIILISTLILGTVIITILIRLLRRYRRKTQLAETRRRHSGQELNTARQRLRDMALEMAQKNELTQQLENDFETISSNISENLPDADNDVLIKLQHAPLLTEDQWEEFRINYEKLYPGFLKRLKEKLPHLTQGEIRFFALIKLHLSNKEMATILGISLQGVRNYRYRLRKKFNLPENEDIEDLLNSI